LVPVYIYRRLQTKFTQPNPIYQRINDRAVRRKFGSDTAHHAAGHRWDRRQGRLNPTAHRWDRARVNPIPGIVGKDRRRIGHRPILDGG